MPNTIMITSKCEISGGAKLGEVITHVCDAYDIISVVVANGVTQQVDLTPEGGPVSLLAIMVPDGVYGEDKLTYRIHEIGATEHYLNNMHMFVGVDAIGALEKDLLEPDILFLKNGDEVPRTFKILVGRDATPE